MLSCGLNLEVTFFKLINDVWFYFKGGLYLEVVFKKGWTVSEPLDTDAPTFPLHKNYALELSDKTKFSDIQTKINVNAPLI